MKKRWYVVDGTEKLLSYDDKAESGEEFKSRRAAYMRATELAKIEPTKMFYVCEAMEAVVVETKPPLRITAFHDPAQAVQADVGRIYAQWREAAP